MVLIFLDFALCVPVPPLVRIADGLDYDRIDGHMTYPEPVVPTGLTPGDTVMIVTRTGVAMVSPARLQAARRAAKLTQTALAEAVRCTRSDISAYETGRTAPLVDTLWKIAGALKTPVRDLLEPGAPLSLQLLRYEAGMRQQDVADTLGWPRSSWAAVERGEATIHPEELPAVRDALASTGRDVTLAEVAAAAGHTTVTDEVEELPDDVVARIDAAARPGESRADVLRRLLPPE
jgi:transcriptional regulator with XRE-family HTH domain